MNTSGSSRLGSMLGLLINRKTACCPDYGMAVYFSKETNPFAVFGHTCYQGLTQNNVQLKSKSKLQNFSQNELLSSLSFHAVTFRTVKCQSYPFGVQVVSHDLGYPLASDPPLPPAQGWGL